MPEPIWDHDGVDMTPRQPWGCEDVSECGAYMCELPRSHGNSLHKSLSTGGSWETGGPVVHPEESP